MSSKHLILKAIISCKNAEVAFKDRFYHSEIPIESKESGIALREKKVER
jgi:hypothetical protein